MEMPTEFERKEWWFYVYAHTSFEKSLECCKLISAHVKSTPPTRHPLYLPLVTAMHAFYGRPFKRIHGINKNKGGINGPELPPDFIPKKFGGLDKLIMTFRDKILVHTDADPVPEVGRPLHDVVYSVRPNSNLFSTNDPRPDIKYCNNVAKLLAILIEKARLRIESFHERFGSLVPKQPGDYMLNLIGPALFTDYQELPSIWRY